MNPCTFVVEEEKCLVSLDRSAQCCAKLVLFVRRLAIIRLFKESARVERLVAQKLPDLTVEIVGA